MRILSLILVLIGGLLLGIDGIIYFAGTPADVLLGITGLVLGLGLILFSLWALSKKEPSKS